jgi:DNA-binding transcriptional regulator LsrR (DeoR family)
VLADTLTAEDILGVSWGRTLHAMADVLPKLPKTPIVQIVGGVPSADLRVNSMELVGRMAERTGGPVFPLHVPMFVGSPEMALRLRREPHVRKTTAMFRQLTKAVVGIGAWKPADSVLREELPPAITATLDAADTTADTCSTVLDDEGHAVTAIDLPARCIAISPDELRDVPDVLAVAGGVGKAKAIRAVLRSGLVHRIITDEDAARALLAL